MGWRAFVQHLKKAEANSELALGMEAQTAFRSSLGRRPFSPMLLELKPRTTATTSVVSEERPLLYFPACNLVTFFSMQ